MNRPAPVEVSYRHMRFLITHNPTNATLSTFIEVSGSEWMVGGCLGSLASYAHKCGQARAGGMDYGWQHSALEPCHGTWDV